MSSDISMITMQGFERSSINTWLVVPLPTKNRPEESPEDQAFPSKDLKLSGLGIHFTPQASPPQCGVEDSTRDAYKACYEWHQNL